MVRKLSTVLALLLIISCNSLFCQEIDSNIENKETTDTKNEIEFLNSPWLPDFNNIAFDYNNIYLEADFNFVVPVLFYGGGLTGVGFSPKFEAGYNWDGWLLGLRYSYSTSLDGSTNLTSNIDIHKNSITLQISKTIDKSLLAFMPSFLQAKPYVGLGVDIISGSYVFNENNCTYNVFGAGFIFNLGLAAELVNFPTITNYATPSVGMEFDFTPDKNGLEFMPSFYIGARTDAKRVIEIVNIIKTAVENKKSAKSTEPAATEEEPAVEQTETPVEENPAPVEEDAAVEEPEATVTSTEQNDKEDAAINTEAPEAEQTTEPLTTPPEPTTEPTATETTDAVTATDSTTQTESTDTTVETEPTVETTEPTATDTTKPQTTTDTEPAVEQTDVEVTTEPTVEQTDVEVTTESSEPQTTTVEETDATIETTEPTATEPTDTTEPQTTTTESTEPTIETTDATIETTDTTIEESNGGENE